MTAIPDPASAHPSWCSPAHCTHPQRLTERGITRDDVPFYLTDAHLSEPYTVAAGHHDEVTVSLQLWRMVDQPVTDEAEGVDMVCQWSSQRLTVGVPVGPGQLVALAEVLAELTRLTAEGEPR